jgi:5'-deoxynucleotidase YfbR-like HD superfamily hydrolase
LLHDAPEYVVGDMISPFKAALGLDYKAFENRLLAAIHVRFGLAASPSMELVASIKQADRMAAYLEATQLAGFTIEEGHKFFGQPKGLNGFDKTLQPMSTAEASRQYIEVFQQLADAT